MITSILQGGLGNQLFQIAATVSLAYDNGVDFGFSTRYQTPMIFVYMDIFNQKNILHTILRESGSCFL